MKYPIGFSVYIFLIGMVFLLIQAKPVYSAEPATAQGLRTSLKNSKMHTFNDKLRKQMWLIQKDLKSGKITKEQAGTAQQKLKAIKKKELEFFRQNGTKELTDDQKNQLTTELENNALGL